MRIIQYKPSVTIVATEEEWHCFRGNLCSEHDEIIGRAIRKTPKNERHSIGITFDYRLPDLFKYIRERSPSLVVENHTVSTVVAESTGIPRFDYRDKSRPRG